MRPLVFHFWRFALGSAVLAATTALSQSLPLLSKSQVNPRYFSDGSNAVYLTGQHVPTAFNDWQGSPVIDFSAFTSNMAAKNHNFLRLWVLDAPLAQQLDGTLDRITPSPFLRTGLGTAADGLAKFDLTQLNHSFFYRLRARVMEADSKGIYVSIMLTNGIFVQNANNFTYSMYRPANNINAGLSSLTNLTQYTLSNSAWVAYMDAYVDKVVDTVNDLSNVLYEVSNEAQSNTSSWQDHVINRIHNREAGKSKQHFVGKTAFGANTSDSAINADLLAGNADWVSLAGRTAPTYTTEVADAPATKVSILDTDHIYGFSIPAADRVRWVWKSFLRGHNPIYITPQTGYPGGFQHFPETENALGQTKALADRIDLLRMTPHDKATSTRYCLASKNIEYLVYQPANSNFTVDLPPRTFTYEWIRPDSDATIESGQFTAAGGERTFSLPGGHATAVLHLKVLGPRIVAMNRLSNGRLVLPCQGDSNTIYRVETAANLGDPFVAAALITSDASGRFTYEDTNPDAVSQRHYRVSLP